MCDRPSGVKATRSPWTDGAWIMTGGDVPAGWQCRRYIDDAGPGWVAAGRYTDACLVEARPEAVA
jgi:hypothetical protein